MRKFHTLIGAVLVGIVEVTSPFVPHTASLSTGEVGDAGDGTVLVGDIDGLDAIPALGMREEGLDASEVDVELCGMLEVAACSLTMEGL